MVTVQIRIDINLDIDIDIDDLMDETLRSVVEQQIRDCYIDDIVNSMDVIG